MVGHGHDARLAGASSLGRMCSVTRDPATGVLAAGADPRGMQGCACGRWCPASALLDALQSSGW